uniref:Uncharacterized protein n=1 Tax=Grammatophora oceanica TaxID=210454 RepID=A0A6U5MR64_9STRA|mmetsp:Transcript_38701/g.57559  ORF Transcript_38701/g.57559 Transcript_38701/m.57559 type:complete len:147 (+) Transcript_38701:133-573(+)|eukprot:CAMPEP_0194039804 /NCGR_PEP_ID=MMETSP0009_2-20130614/11899_1 /TAXON_ID=210454 /ORGANISM="Grammatophora oceanica, Strain CCMP 410" /LENGTH=146 /DNA_ID=CAMNT_0038682751 /DNA_START=92 /DNA_END=532 /DNA_ORIENTATION=+
MTSTTTRRRTPVVLCLRLLLLLAITPQCQGRFLRFASSSTSDKQLTTKDEEESRELMDKEMEWADDEMYKYQKARGNVLPIHDHATMDTTTTTSLTTRPSKKQNVVFDHMAETRSLLDEILASLDEMEAVLGDVFELESEEEDAAL